MKALLLLLTMSLPIFASAAESTGANLRACAYKIAMSDIRELNKSSGSQSRATYRDGAAQMAVTAHVMQACVSEAGLAADLQPKMVGEAISDGIEQAAKDSFVD